MLCLIVAPLPLHLPLSSLTPMAEQLSHTSLLTTLKELHIIRQYPLPVLSPPDYESTFKLFYVPDSIVRAVTFDLDQADEAFILTACSSAAQHVLVRAALLPLSTREEGCTSVC